MPGTSHFRSSKSYSEDLVSELNKELIQKSKDAAPGFMMAAIWITVWKFESVRFVPALAWLGVGLMLLAAFRYLVSFFYSKKRIDLNAATRLTVAIIVTNAAVWSVALVLPMVEFRFENIPSAIGVMSLVISLTLASIVTISYKLLAAFTFQWLVMTPSTVFLYYFWFADGNSTALQGGIMLTILLIYSFRHTRNIHKENVRRMSYALELEQSNRLLVESQDLLIQEKAKLQHSIKLAAVGEISAEIAHEINNPLGIMMGYIELSLEQLRSSAPDREVLLTQLVKAKSAISRITKIIKGLRHYSRRTNDDPLVPVFVNEIIEDAAEFCSEKFNYNKTELEVDNPQDYRLLCRPIEISQVLLNIFSNAVDEVAKLDPDLRRIKVQVSASGEFAKLSISNFGPKIKPELQEKLFEPFFSTKKMGIGTGLGLSISRGIIESYKGRLYYDPMSEQTTFVIELPLYRDA